VATQVGNTDRRVQINAYAAGTQETVSAARRLSLSRALNVRSYLIEQGVRSTRIDVRAIGLPEDNGPADRVDILLLTP
jgi:outer membrane protein OmpA-like peptidoglycan-associated protein